MSRTIALGVAIAAVAIAAALLPPMVSWVALGAIESVALIEAIPPSEVAHLLYGLYAIVLIGGGVVLGLVAGRFGAPHGVRLVLAALPVAVPVAIAARRRHRTRRPPAEVARLLALDLRAHVAAIRTHAQAALVTELLLERDGGRAALEAAATGSDDDRLAAAEAAVWWKRIDRGAALALAAKIVAGGAPVAAVDRALVAIWDGARGEVLAQLRAAAFDDAELRARVLEVRARSGDPDAATDWLADERVPVTTAPAFALALAKPGALAAVRTLRALHPGPRLDALIEALELLG